ncbi:anti-sigma factor family protein [Natranaerofaba carboxydovora]|uniref:anti-sigma factor family protein n=1 Tax=Natranaerofaba carboxydovora TaxID=2742683 RepID=UPI001F12A850|nr:anti-sigma factor [Natranaerofaba carboxydovora]UMZ74804.1 anti_SigH_actin: anti-sigma factor [Natranaerofaba carboxydovora]
MIKRYQRCDESAINLYLDGMLGSEEKEKLSSHIENCPKCERRLEELKNLYSSFDDVKKAAVPVNFEAQVMEEINSKPIPELDKSIYKNRILVGVKIIFIAALIILQGALFREQIITEVSSMLAAFSSVSSWIISQVLSFGIYILSLLEALLAFAQVTFEIFFGIYSSIFEIYFTLFILSLAVLLLLYRTLARIVSN